MVPTVMRKLGHRYVRIQQTEGGFAAELHAPFRDSLGGDGKRYHAIGRSEAEVWAAIKRAVADDPPEDFSPEWRAFHAHPPRQDEGAELNDEQKDHLAFSYLPDGGWYTEERGAALMSVVRASAKDRAGDLVRTSTGSVGIVERPSSR